MKKTAKINALYFIGYVLLILPHMNPPYFNQISFADALLNLARLLSFYVILMRLFVIKRRISKTTFLIVCMEIYLLGITLLRHGETYDILKTVFAILSVTFLYDSINSTDDEPEIFLSALLFCFELMVYINLVTIILYPKGMYRSVATHLFVTNLNYFLGYYNNHDQYFIPALVTASLYAELTGKRLRLLIMAVAVYISSVLLWSGGILLSMFLMFALFVYIYTKKALPRLINYTTCWLLHPVFFILTIFLRLQFIFRWLIEGVFHKWSSILTRIELWNKIMSLISDYPILGHGVLSALYREREAGFYYAIHAHNMLLEVLYQGGLVYLFLLMLLIISSGQEIFPFRNTKTAYILTIGFLGWCVHTTVEPFMTPFLIGMFVLNCKCGLFESIAENRRQHGKKESSPRRIPGFAKRTRWQ